MKCSVCNRLLTSKASIALGVGPTCMRRSGMKSPRIERAPKPLPAIFRRMPRLAGVPRLERKAAVDSHQIDWILTMGAAS